MAVTALEQALSRLAREGELYERLPADRVILTSSYNDPLITSEWAVEVFRGCGRIAGIRHTHHQGERLCVWFAR
jgi:hypothetical protein